MRTAWSVNFCQDSWLCTEIWWSGLQNSLPHSQHISCPPCLVFFYYYSIWIPVINIMLKIIIIKTMGNNWIRGQTLESFNSKHCNSSCCQHHLIQTWSRKNHINTGSTICVQPEPDPEQVQAFKGVIPEHGSTWKGSKYRKSYLATQIT